MENLLEHIAQQQEAIRDTVNKTAVDVAHLKGKVSLIVGDDASGGLLWMLRESLNKHEVEDDRRFHDIEKDIEKAEKELSGELKKIQKTEASDNLKSFSFRERALGVVAALLTLAGAANFFFQVYAWAHPHP